MAKNTLELLREIEAGFNGDMAPRIGFRPAKVELFMKEPNEVCVNVEVSDEYTTFLKVEVLRDVSRVNADGIRYVCTESIREAVEDVIELCKKLVG